MGWDIRCGKRKCVPIQEWELLPGDVKTIMCLRATRIKQVRNMDLGTHAHISYQKVNYGQRMTLNKKVAQTFYSPSDISISSSDAAIAADVEEDGGGGAVGIDTGASWVAT